MGVVQSIDHINLRTPQLEETLSFYEQLLGLRRGRAAGMDQARNAWLYDDADKPIIHVNMPEESEAVPEPIHSGRLHHVALDCAGFDGTVDRIAELGLESSHNYIDEIGLRQIFVFDPNGVRLELNFRKGM